MLYDEANLYPQRHIPIWSEDRKLAQPVDRNDGPDEDDAPQDRSTEKED